jgi:hypothetical protein
MGKKETHLRIWGIVPGSLGVLVRFPNTCANLQVNVGNTCTIRLISKELVFSTKLGHFLGFSPLCLGLFKIVEITHQPREKASTL